MYMDAHLNIIWSPTLKVRVIVMPGPGGGGCDG
jgi:hypothetical protein